MQYTIRAIFRICPISQQELNEVPDLNQMHFTEVTNNELEASRLATRIGTQGMFDNEDGHTVYYPPSQLLKIIITPALS